MRLSLQMQLRLLALLLMAGILALVINYPTGYAANLLYVGVILLGLWAPDPRLAIEVAVASTGLSLISRALIPAGGNAAMGYFNLSLSVLVIWATAIGLLRYRRSAPEQGAASLRAQRYLDVVSVAVRLLDPAGRILLMNRRGLELLGRSEAEVVGHSWDEFIRPEDRSAWREALQGLNSAPSPSRTSHMSRLMTPDGRSPVVLWTNVALYDDEGRHIGTLSSGEDISGRLAAEEALRKSVKDLQDLKYALDQSAIVATTDVRGDITYVNEKFCEISKYSRQRTDRGKPSDPEFRPAPDGVLQTDVRHDRAGTGVAWRDSESREGRLALLGGHDRRPRPR